jgi:hypothetical protein
MLHARHAGARELIGMHEPCLAFNCGLGWGMHTTCWLTSVLFSSSIHSSTSVLCRMLAIACLQLCNASVPHVLGRTGLASTYVVCAVTCFYLLLDSWCSLFTVQCLVLLLMQHARCQDPVMGLASGSRQACS